MIAEQFNTINLPSCSCALPVNLNKLYISSKVHCTYLKRGVRMLFYTLYFLAVGVALKLSISYRSHNAIKHTMTKRINPTTLQ
jgi:hypothetical protein